MPKILKPKLIFYIDKSNRNKKGYAPIKANITIDGKKQTQIIDHVLPSDWNRKQDRVKSPRPGKRNRHEFINGKLQQLQEEFSEFVDNCELKQIILTPEIAKRFLHGERNFFTKSFWQVYDEYLDQLRVQPKTLQNYKLYKTKLSEFEIESKYNIDYHTIDTAFFERYQYYILTEKGLGWNTFATAIKKLKFFMSWSLKMKYHSEQGFRQFSATEKRGTVIFLTKDELTKLYKHNFENERLNQVRDKYCFGCYTGLAFSDLDSLTHEHINNGTLTKLRQKTKIPLNVPLPPQAVKILQRYKGKYKALPKIGHQKFNEYIKECCRIAEINSKTVYKTFSKGIESENIAPKYELIGSHTARKTFITYLYHMTKDVILTAKIAGCSPDIIRKHYVGTDRDMEEEAMRKAFGE